MVRWIEDNNNIGNILKFSGYSRLFPLEIKPPKMI